MNELAEYKARKENLLRMPTVDKKFIKYTTKLKLNLIDPIRVKIIEEYRKRQNKYYENKYHQKLSPPKVSKAMNNSNLTPSHLPLVRVSTK